METKLLTVKEVAQYLDVSVRQVYRLIESGMPSFRVGKYHRFIESNILEWIKECQKK